MRLCCYFLITRLIRGLAGQRQREIGIVEQDRAEQVGAGGQRDDTPVAG